LNQSKDILLVRVAEPKSKDRTWGRLTVFDFLQAVWDFCTIELPWKENGRNVSRIPVGDYPYVVEQDPAHYRGIPYIRIQNVPGRSGILAHVGCFPRDTEGCTLVGMRFSDLDGDGIFDVTGSENAMRLLCGALGGVGAKGTIHVRDIC
jgi:hypothetical protein